MRLLRLAAETAPTPPLDWSALLAVAEATVEVGAGLPTPTAAAALSSLVAAAR